MSHLTAPMPSGHQTHKPYRFDFPRPAHPLTPPDTDYETPSHHAPPAQNAIGLETEPFAHQHHPSMTDSSFAPLHKKRPSVTYVNSGIRDSRERVVQRGIKWLVVVLPPVSFTREHGHLGHTLSSGPTRRLSNGLLMALYPTLNSQLSAIAREFSFPSISGICVYLHTTHGGLSLSPRVSDESWPILWSHLFDARSPSLPSQQLPISGQIEFDIDLSKARWYDAWLSSSRRDYVDVPQSVTPSRAQSISHWRGDSQTSINEALDDQLDAISVVQPGRPTARNIKKLSLLDRFDGASARSGSRLVPRDESPPSQTARQGGPLHTLSPIVQEDEPATAKKEFDSRVQSWRISATVAARSPLAATGQTSLDPANMPNTMGDLPTASTMEMQSELNLDDYTWSVSSVGPQDYDLESLASWDRVPSVHMDRRFAGSVCLTPSYCTSFGPDDDEYLPFSPVSYMSRFPSPDIAWRMFEDVPPTPATATSWGAPLSYPPSPLSSPYAPSVDIAARHMPSRPATPSTATSWGAPLSYPSSPLMSSRPPSPDIGERGMSSVPSSPKFHERVPSAQPYSLVYPYYDAARASSWQHVWPHAQGSNVGQEQVIEHQAAGRMHNFVFPPPASRPKSGPWKQVWPYATHPTGSEDQAAEPRTPFGYPILNIYPAVYPSFDIYPALPNSGTRKPGVPTVSSGAAYPTFNLYPAVYPFFDIYPATVTAHGSKETTLSTYITGYYPHLIIYPVVSNASSGTATTTSRNSQRLKSEYPVFDIYPAVYPYCFELYPAVSLAHTRAKSPVNGPSDCYPVSVYNIYSSVKSASKPRVSVSVCPQYPVFEIYPPVSRVQEPRFAPAILVTLSRNYPNLEIYPAVYPWNLKTVYPDIPTCRSRETGIVVKLASVYPVFDIYPAVYPWNLRNVYPDAPKRLPTENRHNGVVVKLTPSYPVFDIYPAVYPWNLQTVYPSVLVRSHLGNQYHGVVKLAVVYPVFDIYPAVYPHSLQSIYPALPSASPAERPRIARASAIKSSLSLRPSARSIHIRKSSLKRNLPPVPPLPKNARELLPFSPVSRQPLPTARVVASVPVHLDAVYPNVCPYPPVYPHFAIYPAKTTGNSAVTNMRLNVRAPSVYHYPYLVIYPSVYPHVEIYPGSWTHPVVSPPAVAPPTRPKYSHMELRSQVFASTQIPIAPKATPVPAQVRPTFSPMQLREEVFAEERVTRQQELPKVIVAAPSPATPDLFSPPEPDFEIVTPVVRSAGPMPSWTPFSPPEPDFEIVAAPAPAPMPMSAGARAPPVPPMPAGLTRSRSGTVNSRPPMPPLPRPIGARPTMSMASPVGSSDISPAPSPSRTINRLSGLPAHPAANRRISSAAPRPMSTFGPLPAVPLEQSPAPSPIARRQKSLMSPLEEGRPSPISRSPQLPSPPDDWQRGYRTPTDTSPTSRLPGSDMPNLSRSNTMPSRAAPRGPRSSTLISERARAFSAANGNGSAGAPEAELMSTLAEFPVPPRPPMPSSPARPAVSRLDRSKYPFA
ncbi:hypothetical protein BC628DRAFT_1346585 [Trametes gibbosa]|nr:hypothetical protein BC628DRAFT_1346585 [Trametes gibbosa]